MRVPLDLDHPYWIEDEEFDLEYHVRHIALPKPGDWRQFCIQVARLHARGLDLARPLWEMYVIEGLDGIEGLPKGSFGVVIKVHHAAIDGMAGVELITAIHDQTRRRRSAASAGRAVEVRTSAVVDRAAVACGREQPGPPRAFRRASWGGWCPEWDGPPRELRSDAGGVAAADAGAPHSVQRAGDTATA